MTKTKAKVKLLFPKTADVKYTGSEPEWHLQPTEEHRRGAMLSAFNWYNYHYGKKDAKEFAQDWVDEHLGAKEAKAFKSVSEQNFPLPIGWLCRMSAVGFELAEEETARIKTTVTDHIAALQQVKKVVEQAEDSMPRVTIQDRLREKAIECAGELEGLFDEFMLSGFKMSADYKPIVVIRSMNISPQHVGVVADIWKKRLAEFEVVAQGKDAQLVEGYEYLSKVQVRNLIKFAETVVNDCGAYVQIKKVERKPRAAKAISPEKRAAKFKYMLEFPELKLKSIHPSKLVDASEAWLYETKKRKLIHVVADPHVGTFTIKSNSIIGFSTTDTTQKTVRKPADTIKAIAAAGKPQARKVFKDLTTTETNFNGRGTENLVVLKYW